MSEPVEIHLPIESSEVASVELLHHATGLPKQRIKRAMTQGAVWLTRGRNTQRLRRAKRPLREGDELHLYYDADILAEVPAEPTLIADVGTYSVWQKPYGLRSQGSKWGRSLHRRAVGRTAPQTRATGLYGSSARQGGKRSHPGGAFQDDGGGAVRVISSA